MQRDAGGRRDSGGDHVTPHPLPLERPQAARVGAPYVLRTDQRARLLAAYVLALTGFVVLALLVQRFDAPLVLGVMLCAGAGVALLLWPQLATLLMAFLLYTNIPAVAYKYHGVPKLLAGGFMLLLLIPLGSHLVVHRERVRIDRTFGLMLLFLAVLLIASLRAMDMGIAMERALTFAFEGLLLYVLVTNVVRTLPALRRVVWTLLAAGSLLGAMSLYQEVTGDFARQFGGLAHRNYDFMVLEARLAETPDDPVLLEQKARMRDNRSRRAEGPMDEPNGYAQIMIVLLPLALFTYRTAASRRAQLSAALAGALILGGMITSMSRGAMLAFGLLLIAAAAVRWIRPSRLLIVVLLIAAAAPFVASDRLVQRLSSIGSAVSLLRGDGAQVADHAIRGRATEMIAAFRVFTDYPLLGVGPGQYAPFYSAEYHQNDPRFQFRELNVARRAHSLYLEIGAELGIAGLAVFLAIVAALMRDLRAARHRWSRTRPDLAHLATALWLSILGYLMTGVFLHLMYERYYWMLLAIAGSALHVIRLHERGNTQPVFSQPSTAGA